jgi:hypothetical protein
MANNNDLLDGLTEDDTEVIDLLDTIDDSDAPAWIPETPGEGIQGKLVSKYEIDDDYNHGEKVPVWVVQVSDDENLRVTGFQTVLRREMKEKDPPIGATVAVKRLNDRTATKGKGAGKPYPVVKVAFRV